MGLDLSKLSHIGRDLATCDEYAGKLLRGEATAAEVADFFRLATVNRESIAIHLFEQCQGLAGAVDTLTFAEHGRAVECFGQLVEQPYLRSSMVGYIHTIARTDHPGWLNDFAEILARSNPSAFLMVATAKVMNRSIQPDLIPNRIKDAFSTNLSHDAKNLVTLHAKENGKIAKLVLWEHWRETTPFIASRAILRKALSNNLEI